MDKTQNTFFQRPEFQAGKGAPIPRPPQIPPQGPPPLPHALPPAPQRPTPQGPLPSRFVGVLRLLLGIGLTAVGGYLTLYNLGRTSVDLTTSVVVFFAVILGAGVRLLVTGGAQSAGRRVRLLPGLGVFVLVALAVFFTLPRAAAARRATAEREAWDRLQASAKTYDDYKSYTSSTKTRRRGVPAAMALAQTREELAKPPDKGGRVAKLRELLRSHVYQMEKTGEAELQAAIDLTRQGLAETYASALADLGDRVGKDTARREFPEDPRMRSAFAAVITRLAKSDDDWVYLDFASDNQLAETQAEPAGAPSFIPRGEAFSPERDSRRRAAFSTAMTESLKQAFRNETLIRIQSLPANANRKGKVVFQVKCTTRSIAGGFTLTRDGKYAGMLSNFEVDWEFSAFDVDGKLLARNRSRSNPAQSIRFSQNLGEPDWAPYSVLMDSAYYNYCREITGRLGLIPPPVKESFTFVR
jgi:hypothetical protein